MKNFKIFTTSLIVLLMMGSAFAKPNGLDRIKRAGTLTVGIKNDVPGFGYLNPKTNQYEGIGSEDKITFVPVNAKNRSAFLNQDRVDIVAATFTVTDERKQNYDFSDIYYTDSVGLMVKRSSSITSFRSLENKKIGVTQGSMTITSIKNAAIKEGVFINVVTYPSNRTLKDALDHGEIDAFAIDTSILHGYSGDDVRILPEHYDEMHYAVAIKKDNSAVTKLVNEVIKEMIKDGELEKILIKYNLKD